MVEKFLSLIEPLRKKLESLWSKAQSTLYRTRENQGAQQTTRKEKEHQVFNPNDLNVYLKVPDSYEVSEAEQRSYNQKALQYFRGHVADRLIFLKQIHPDQYELIENALKMHSHDEELFRSLRRIQEIMLAIPALQSILDLVEFNISSGNTATDRAQSQNLQLIFNRLQKKNIIVDSSQEPLFKDAQAKIVTAELKVEQARWVIETSESNLHNILLFAELITNQILTRKEMAENSAAHDLLDRVICERLFIYATDPNIRPLFNQKVFHTIQMKAGRIAFSLE